MSERNRVAEVLSGVGSLSISFLVGMGSLILFGLALNRLEQMLLDSSTGWAAIGWAAPLPEVYCGVLVEAMRKYFLLMLLFFLPLGFLGDWLALRSWARVRDLARVWAWSLTVATSAWIAVALTWVGLTLVASARSSVSLEDPRLDRTFGTLAGLYLPYSFAIWCAVAVLAWLAVRWLRFPTVAADKQSRARCVAVFWPAALIAVALVLSTRAT